MDARSSRWKAITQTQYPWEREALDFVRERLPDHDPYLAWANFEFVAEDGSVNEVDLLVLTPKGFFLVEIKSRPGTVSGDLQSWVWKNANGVWTTDNPHILANRKAKRLKSLLQRHAANREDLPFLRAVVFLSAEKIDVQLDAEARHDVAIRDRGQGSDESAPRSTSSIPGIVQLLKAPNPEDLARGRGVVVDRVVAKSVARAVHRAGIEAGERHRRVNEYRLGALLGEGRGWQDFLAEHTTLRNLKRRIRLYTVALGGSAEIRDTIARAARREFEILRGAEHPGILRALEYASHEAGPALIFDHPERAQRLDHFLAEHVDRLGIDARLSILRQVAEALRYAHGRRVFHRALAPSSLLVCDPTAATPEVRVFNWQTATREIISSGSHSVVGTVHLDRLVEPAEEAYMAPEALTAPDEGAEALDVFSLGALAYHLFAGRPPAPSGVDLRARLLQSGGLDPAEGASGTPESLRTLVLEATAPEVHRRTASVADFLVGLACVEEELTRPPSDAVANPLDAKPGDRLDGGFEVLRRLGAGATSIAYLVKRDRETCVLKVSRGADQDERVRQEGEVLSGLHHQYVVRFIDSVEVSGRRALILSHAGDRTLRDRLKEDGPLSLDLLSRFGDNLLDVVRHLEEVGVAHRDIKPDNIGVSLVSEKILRPILFDFSLSRTPSDQIRAGTPGYLEPFLESRAPRRWDVHAELWAAVVTLYEMATGVLPRWGDGRSDPAMVPGEVTIESDRLDAGVRTGLAAFFRKALSRDVGKRFHNASALLEAWRKVFLGASSEPAASAAGVAADLDAQLAAATLDTSLGSLSLSTRALNALERAGALTVRDLLRLPPNRVAYMRGVGHKTRRELLHTIEVLSKRLSREAALGPAEETAPTGEGSRSASLSLARLESLLLPPEIRDDPRPASAVARRLLGLGADGRALPGRGQFPNFDVIGKECGVTRARVGQIKDRLLKRWSGQPEIEALRTEVARIIETLEGAATFDEVATALAATHGEGHAPEVTLHRARVALRAAWRAEREGLSRWTERRVHDGLLFVLAGGEGSESDGTDAEDFADYADRLGQRADALAAEDDVPAPSRVEEELRSVRVVPGRAPLSRARLVRLATACSDRACVSARLEVYPRGIAAARALRLAHGAVAPRGPLAPADLRARVLAYYPEAEPLPDRPALDALLASAGFDLRWEPSVHEGQGAYLPKTLDPTGMSSPSSAFHRLQTSIVGQVEVSPEVADARRFEERMARALREGAYLVLRVEASRQRDLIDALVRRYGVEAVSLDARILHGLREAAEEFGATWDVVVRADASPAGSQDRRNLLTLVDRVLPAIESSLLETPGTVLLAYPGLLARYDKFALLERMRDHLGVRTGSRRAKLQGLWVVVPTDDQQELPVLDGKAIPVITPSEWASVPLSWIRNQHRASVAGAVAGAAS